MRSKPPKSVATHAPGGGKKGASRGLPPSFVANSVLQEHLIVAETATACECRVVWIWTRLRAWNHREGMQAALTNSNLAMAVLTNDNFVAVGVCVPNILSALISRKNRLTSAHHDRAAVFRNGRLGRAIQVEEPA